MGKIIKEDIKYNVIKTRNGKQMIYIMGTNSQSNDLISANQETLKKFGAVYNPQMRKWVWWLSGDESEVKKQIAAYVYPCIKEIIAQETIDKGGELDSNIQNTINTLLNDINKVLKTSLTSDDLNGTDEKIDINAIKHEIMAFKEKLVKITSSEEFKKVFGPIIEFSKVMGPGFSLINCILIMIQDPEATLVKSRGNWKFSNREVVSGAKPIALYMPHGEKKYKSPASRKIATAKFLLNKGVKRVEDLTPGDRETLNKELNRVVKVEFWTLEPNWFDHRFTRVMNNKEDLAPIGSKQRDKNTQIYDENAPATEETIKLYDAVVSSIKKTGLKVTYKDNLGGARGIAKGDGVDLLLNTKKNICDVTDAVHEFAHTLLHQEYLRNQSEEYAQFFLGRKDSRDKREQQAELVAWIVSNYFGYDVPTSINYMGCWGIDEKKAPLVFDTVANVASFIIKKINENMKTNMKESMNIENNKIISGQDVANLVGMGDIYRKNKKYTTKLTEDKLRGIIRDVIKEAYETVQFQHFDNDEKRYESYVLVDNSVGSVIANYVVYPGDWWKDVFDEACYDAKEQSNTNRYGSYSVYGCIGDTYDDDTLLYTAE